MSGEVHLTVETLNNFGEVFGFPKAEDFAKIVSDRTPKGHSPSAHHYGKPT